MRRVIHGYSKLISSFIGSLTGSSKWYGGVLAPNGKIYGIPLGVAKILNIMVINNFFN